MEVIKAILRVLLLIVAAISVVVCIFSGIWLMKSQQECTSWEYENTMKEYVSSPAPELQEMAKDALEDGFLSKTEYSELWDTKEKIRLSNVKEKVLDNEGIKLGQ
jgi:hypothetical protein